MAIVEMHLKYIHPHIMQIYNKIKVNNKYFFGGLSKGK